MNKKIYILVLAVFGFLMMPDAAFSCKKKYSETTLVKNKFLQKKKTKIVAKLQIIAKVNVIIVVVENVVIPIEIFQ